jgi:hypothetical protein
MLRRFLLAAVLGTLLFVSRAAAQEGRSQEFDVQGTAFFTKDSNGNGIDQHATDTGGSLLSLRSYLTIPPRVDYELTALDIH